jgi:hypothetical protein|tara:strand:- start:2563 stop:2748 length:186 start_codon:yes stop_codon:yes gene_type:complete
MDIVNILGELQNEINFQLKEIQNIYMSGSLRDMEQHKFLQGQLHSIYNMQEFINKYKKLEE